MDGPENIPDGLRGLLQDRARPPMPTKDFTLDDLRRLVRRIVREELRRAVVAGASICVADHRDGD